VGKMALKDLRHIRCFVGSQRHGLDTLNPPAIVKQIEWPLKKRHTTPEEKAGASPQSASRDSNPHRMPVQGRTSTLPRIRLSLINPPSETLAPVTSSCLSDVMP
jgi:hypothetical protein